MEPPSDKHLDEAGDNLLKGGDKVESDSQDKGHSVALALGGSGPLCLYLGAAAGLEQSRGDAARRGSIRSCCFVIFGNVTGGNIKG